MTDKPYVVSWMIKIFDAEDEVDAVLQAVDILRDHGNIATFFKVTDPNGIVTNRDFHKEIKGVSFEES